MQDILRIIKPYTVSLSEETLWYISVYNIPYKNASKNLPRYEYLENIKYRAQVFRPLKLGVYSWKPRVSDKLLRWAIKDSQHMTGKTFLKTDVTNFRCRNSQDIATGDTIIRSSQEWHPAEPSCQDQESEGPTDHCLRCCHLPVVYSSSSAYSSYWTVSKRLKFYLC